MEKIIAEVKKQDNGELFLLDVIFRGNDHEEKILSESSLAPFKNEDEIRSFIKTNPLYSAYNTHDKDIQVQIN